MTIHPFCFHRTIQNFMITTCLMWYNYLSKPLEIMYDLVMLRSHEVSNFYQTEIYGNNHLILTMGNDSQYHNAHRWYKNLDKLIDYVNGQVSLRILAYESCVSLSRKSVQQSSGSDVNVFYSTPSCYLYALNKLNQTWTTKTDDFFPYSRTLDKYQTGFFYISTSTQTLRTLFK